MVTFNPSIHITKTELINLFNKYDFPIKYIDNFLADAAKVSCTNRTIIHASNQKMLAAYNAKVDVSKENIFTFNGYLVSILKDRFAGKRKVNKINQSSVQYRVLKEVTVLALEFCEIYGLETNIGFPKYIKLGLEVIGKNYRLNKFIYKHSDIVDYYGDKLAAKNDCNAKLTKKLHKIYCILIYDLKGFTVDYRGSVQEYVNFVYAAEEAVKAKASPKIWIESQFEQLKFLDAVPELGALHGKNAKSRYEKYCIKTNADKEDELTREQAEFIKKLKKSRKKKDKKELKTVIESSVQDIKKRIEERINKRMANKSR